MAVWQTRPVAEVCTMVTDGSHFSPSTVPTGYPYITVRDIKQGQIDFQNCAFIDESSFDELRRNGCAPSIGDVLFSKDGTVGKVALVDSPREFVVLSSLAILRPNTSLIEPAFLSYVLMSPAFLAAAIGQKTGVAIRRIILKNLKQIPVPYPALHEQRRIVAILDEAFEAIATAKVNTEKNLQNGRSVFYSLLNSMFASSEWQQKTIGELFRVGSSKRVLKSQWQSQGIPFYRGREVTRLAKDGFVDNELFISEALYAELSSQYGVPDVGDIMVTAIGTIGNAYVVRQGDHFYFKDASVLWLKKTTDVSSEFINYWLRSDQFLEQLDRGNGATVDTLTIQKLQSVTLKMPLLSEQRRIVVKLDALAASAERLEKLYGGKLAALDELKKSLLHQAFTGKLTAKSTDQQLEAVA